ncbi:phosphatidylinositol N-acetylglucosaminyltransferase subunit C-like [Octopus vulgaris]|uniref:Phosphatidylinositol N-acetylglucosaminyltransferase subunit C-like n=2 Tax=Octopus TaxID=6643 RepID=A0AA36EY80_OCTVU|nr:phosphatidylinositol N-acetylglucosaminyltransferase subunit C-like [Octopus sinensis]XP_036362637.1 phosphatidylinositol N-acetylglucosaminyltransferase subunit C-like [Octopus sinensis]XP_036362641.1 phosphatidylinositol N-acetylglucosaminyltransferase subunit C-like [Octopus sinensis]CAI9716318.1 phosphatidylinositol N-acetylglucosaminyltransferase subunit C-like [Octopus vulgaris]
MTRSKWQKILYEDQGVSDNYVDETFLDELKKNLYIRSYDYWRAAQESGTFTQQMCSVCIFVVVFIYMDQEKLSPQVLFIVSSLLTLIGYCIKVIIHDKQEINNKRTKMDDLKTAVIFVSFSLILCPVLVSLTQTISTDTIYCMSTVMLLSNVLFHDYGPYSAVVSSPLSLNAAIFAAVCLASRLHTPLHAFSIVTFALEIFALWPMLRIELKKRGSICQNTMSVLVGVIASAALWSVSPFGATIFITVHLLINFACPAWLCRLQSSKNNIYGPWDEAIINSMEHPKVARN